MAYSTKILCPDCGVEIDPDFQAFMFQDMVKNPKYGKWWRANKCVPCNTRHMTEMINTAFCHIHHGALGCKTCTLYM